MSERDRSPSGPERRRRERRRREEEEEEQARGDRTDYSQATPGSADEFGGDRPTGAPPGTSSSPTGPEVDDVEQEQTGGGGSGGGGGGGSTGSGGDGGGSGGGATSSGNSQSSDYSSASPETSDQYGGPSPTPRTDPSRTSPTGTQIDRAQDLRQDRQDRRDQRQRQGGRADYSEATRRNRSDFGSPEPAHDIRPRTPRPTEDVDADLGVEFDRTPISELTDAQARNIINRSEDLADPGDTIAIGPSRGGGSVAYVGPDAETAVERAFERQSPGGEIFRSSPTGPEIDEVEGGTQGDDVGIEGEDSEQGRAAAAAEQQALAETPGLNRRDQVRVTEDGQLELTEEGQEAVQARAEAQARRQYISQVEEESGINFQRSDVEQTEDGSFRLNVAAEQRAQVAQVAQEAGLDPDDLDLRGTSGGVPDSTVSTVFAEAVAGRAESVEPSDINVIQGEGQGRTQSPTGPEIDRAQEQARGSAFSGFTAEVPADVAEELGQGEGRDTAAEQVTQTRQERFIEGVLSGFDTFVDLPRRSYEGNTGVDIPGEGPVIKTYDIDAPTALGPRAHNALEGLTGSDIPNDRQLAQDVAGGIVSTGEGVYEWATTPMGDERRTGIGPVDDYLDRMDERERELAEEGSPFVDDPDEQEYLIDKPIDALKIVPGPMAAGRASAAGARGLQGLNLGRGAAGIGTLGGLGIAGSELDVGEERQDRSELEVGEQSQSELDQPTEPGTGTQELRPGEFFADSELSVSVVEQRTDTDVLQTGATVGETGDQPTGPASPGVELPESPGPTITEDEGDTGREVSDERSFPTGEGAVVGFGDSEAVEETQDRVNEAQRPSVSIEDATVTDGVDLSAADSPAQSPGVDTSPGDLLDSSESLSGTASATSAGAGTGQSTVPGDASIGAQTGQGDLFDTGFDMGQGEPFRTGRPGQPGRGGRPRDPDRQRPSQDLNVFEGGRASFTDDVFSTGIASAEDVMGGGRDSRRSGRRGRSDADDLFSTGDLLGGGGGRGGGRSSDFDMGDLLGGSGDSEDLFGGSDGLL